MPVPKAPTIALLWSKLSKEERDRVTEAFLNWLASAGASIKSSEDLLVLANLVSYHAQDLKLVVKNALKEEFKEVADEVAELVGVMG